MNQLVVSFQSDSRGFNCITSIQVADLFDLRHGNVLRKIVSLTQDGDLDELNSEFISRRDSLKREKPMYLLTETGFTVLVLSFNLRIKKQKETRNKILSHFQERSIQQHQRLTQLEECLSGLRVA